MPSDTQERWKLAVHAACGQPGYLCGDGRHTAWRFVEVIPASTATQLAEALERLLDATDSLLPTEGPSEARRMSERVSSVMGAEPEEWATAAHYWIEARTALTHYRGEGK